MTKVLVATEKPFAKAAVDGIRKITEDAGFELALLEKYTDVSEFYTAVADADALIVRSDKVTKEVMANADENAIFLHCLPAYRGFEVTEDVIDGPHSRIFQEAENRLHAQKAIMTMLMADSFKK
jgi:ornithine carbamoyltransferase